VTIFAVAVGLGILAVGLGILAAAPFLVRQRTKTQTRRAGATHHGDTPSGAQEPPAS
jgi:hypothetical protein